MRVIKLKESDLEKIVKRVLVEQTKGNFPAATLTPPQPQQSSLQPTMNTKSGTYDGPIQIQLKPYEVCVPKNIISFVWWVHQNQKEIMSKLGIDINLLKLLLKASVGIFGRETTFADSKRYSVKSFLDSIDFNTDLLVGSHGPAQMQKSTYKDTNVEKLFGMKPNDLYKIIGSGSAVITYLTTSYKKAIQNGYTTGKSSNIEGTGNSALDIAIGSYNAGQDKIVKYCKTSNPQINSDCANAGKQIEPKKGLQVTVTNQPVQNYIPNFPTKRTDTGLLTTHGYIKEVAGYIKNYGCIDSI